MFLSQLKFTSAVADISSKKTPSVPWQLRWDSKLAAQRREENNVVVKKNVKFTIVFVSLFLSTQLVYNRSSHYNFSTNRLQMFQ